MNRPDQARRNQEQTDWRPSAPPLPRSITIFGTDDRENQAVGVFLEHHPEAKFKDSKPDGVRFIGALARFHGLIGTCQEICDGHNENHTTGQVLNVKKTDKGILWTINAGGV